MNNDVCVCIPSPISCTCMHNNGKKTDRKTHAQDAVLV